MASNLIGNLAVNLTMETAAFQKGATIAEKRAQAMQKRMQGIGESVKGFGESMTKWVTLPVLGAGAAVLKIAGDFEAGMGRVGISTQASAEEMAKMRDLALDIGKTTTKSASESADAMDMLAKAGLSASDILNGAARATVALAEAAGSDLDPAASAITDTMQQFNKTTEDLPNIINNITGAVNESKFGFEDFQLGMAQAGGVASSAGLGFEEFTAALAATASQFASGSDAGTSMKTFLLSLTPATKKAREAMEEAGFSAFDLQGNLKPLAQIAQDLKDKFGNLSEADLNATFKEMFGTDAIRTAIGLMKQGAAGITDMQARIAATDASAQAADRMKGLNAEMEKLGGAFETLAINIADSGLLSAITGVVSSIGEWVDYMAEANPEILKWGTIIAGVVAVIGPLLIGIGSIVSSIGVMLPAIVSVGGAIATLAGIITGGAIPAIGSLLVVLAPILVPLAAVAAAAGAVYLAYKNWDKIVIIVRNVWDDIKGIFTKFIDNLVQIGRNMIAGLARGISAAKDVVWNALKGAVLSGINNVKAFLGIQSPSRLFMQMGGFVSEGFAIGITSGAPKVAGAMKLLATEAVKGVSELEKRVRGIVERLFPEVRQALDYQSDRNTIVEWAEKAGWSVDQLNDSLRRLNEEHFGKAPKSIDLSSLDLIVGRIPRVSEKIIELRDISIETSRSVAEDFENIANAIGNAARNIGGAIRGIGDAFKNGDIFDKIGAIADLISVGANTFGNLSSTFGGARANGGPVTGGKTYLVGERGPELYTASRSGYITSNKNMNSGGGAMRVEIVDTTGLFETRVTQTASNVTQAGIGALESRRNFSTRRGIR
jgi:TP901 family phage tail tape measure protein